MVKKIAENFNRLSRVHQRYRQTTDGRPIAYSEREREFTSAKNCVFNFSVHCLELTVRFLQLNAKR